MLILKLKPSVGKGSRDVSDSRGPGDAVRLRVPPGDRERVILVMLSELCGLSAKVGFVADADVKIEREDANS